MHKKTAWLSVACCAVMLVVTASAQAGVSEEALLKLEIARANLRISEAAEADVAEGLSRLHDSGNATVETLQQYETYRERLHDIVLENRNIVARLEAAYARYAATGGSTPAAGTLPAHSRSKTDLPLPEEQDELAALEHDFQKTLSDFDDMLLREMEEIDQRSTEALQQLSEAADQAAQDIGEGESGSGSSGEETSSETTADASGTQNPESGQETGMEAQGRSDAATPSHETGYEKPAADQDQQAGERENTAGTPQDDDIVARQLREAAEKETDPELKKKLWKEYEEYKKGR